MSHHPNLTDRQRYAAYYTPAGISELLCQFAIRSSEDTVLEPSFGGGAVLKAALERLRSLRAERPELQLWGCDIDEHAFLELRRLFGGRTGRKGRRFAHTNFLSVQPSDFSRPSFTSIVGNPPFIGYHRMDACSREAVLDLFRTSECTNIGFPASWCGFILQSLNLLESGGRLAFVLPYALLDSEYSKPVRQLLGRKFENTTIVSIEQSLFKDQGTHERTVLVFADNYDPQGDYDHEPALHTGAEVNEITRLINPRRIAARRPTLRSSLRRLNRPVSSGEINLLNAEIQRPYTRRLGELIDIKIGLVTGDSKFFTHSLETAQLAGLNPARHFQPIVRRLKGHSGISYRDEDYARDLSQGDRCLLLRYSPDLMKDKSYLRYINDYDPVLLSNNKTFDKREVWCQVDDGKTPDFFMLNMAKKCARVVVNDAALNCVNNTHRGYAKERMTDAERMLIAISTLTDFTQACLEISARRHHGDTLKLEPSVYADLPLMLPIVSNEESVQECFSSIDQLMRSDDYDGAREAANEFIFPRAVPEKLLKKVRRGVGKLYFRLRMGRV